MDEQDNKLASSKVKDTLIIDSIELLSRLLSMLSCFGALKVHLKGHGSLHNTDRVVLITLQLRTPELQK